MNFIKSDDGKIREVTSDFVGMQSSLNRIWLPAWTPGELREIADKMEDNGFLPPFESRDIPKLKHGDPWRLTPEQRDLDEQMNGDDERPY